MEIIDEIVEEYAAVAVISEAEQSVILEGISQRWIQRSKKMAKGEWLEVNYDI